jgi:2',3'-cyclic-nucleotide 2'-phosphodiesterase (5'-nucleotidase family)
MKSVFFLHFGDVYHLKNAPQFKTLIDILQKKYNPITTFGGDFVAPSLMSTFTKGQHMAEILSELNIDYGCLGNHEFDFGIKRLHQLINEKSLFKNSKILSTKWIMSNLFDPISQNPICKSLEFVVLVKNEIKIGIFSLVDDWTEQAGLTTKESTYLNYVDVGNRLCKKLREDGCELIVVLTHSLLAVDREMSMNLPEVDFFLGAHDHIIGGYYDTELKFSKAGFDFEDIMLIEFIISKDSKVSVKREMINVTNDLEKNQNIIDIIKKYQQEMDRQMDVVIGSSKVEMDCRKITLRGREASFGNLLADFLRNEMKTDTAILTGGLISSDKIWECGELNMGFVISVFPWEGTCVSIEISGKDIVDALENGVSWLPREDGRFMQVSGITLEYDVQKKKIKRVSNVKINGKEVELEKMYSVAMTEFLSLGGEGFTMFKNAKKIVTVENGIPQIDLLKKLMEECSPLNPQLDGRMKSLSEYIVLDQ